MHRPIAMIVAGVVTSLAVIGSTVAAMQTGVFINTTTVQSNADINVAVDTVKIEKTIPVKPTIEDTQTPPAPIVQIITKTVTETLPPPPMMTPKVILVENAQREAVLTAKLNEVYKLLADRDAMYQAKLKEAYDKLTALQAGAQDTSGGGGNH